jgi:hypothetical protein
VGQWQLQARMLLSALEGGASSKKKAQNRKTDLTKA